jgi:hypothetical protein
MIHGVQNPPSSLCFVFPFRSSVSSALSFTSRAPPLCISRPPAPSRALNHFLLDDYSESSVPLLALDVMGSYVPEDKPFGDTTVQPGFMDHGNDMHPRRGSKSKKFGGMETADTTSADDLLEAMGYASELTRNRSTLQVAFMSFVLASIPYGLATTFFYPLVGGGPANIIWGWVAVSIIILCVAISLGEITSVYPTAGGVYYQTFMLSPPWCRKITSWICGWSYVVGNITITLAVNFGTTLFFIACINVFESEPGVGIFQAETYQIFLIFVGITLLCNAVSALGNKWLPLLDVSIQSVLVEIVN